MELAARQQQQQHLPNLPELDHKRDVVVVAETENPLHLLARSLVLYTAILKAKKNFGSYLH
jgi:hypothetical protein